jgi:IS30 family transposase
MSYDLFHTAIISYENTNHLLKKCFPKKTDMSIYTQVQLNTVAIKTNIGFSTPAENLNNYVVAPTD